MNFDAKIKALKSKKIGTDSQIYKQNRPYAIIKNGEIREAVQHLKNERNKARYKSNLTKNEVRQIEKFFKVDTLPEVIRHINFVAPKLQLADTVIYYFRKINPAYNAQKITKQFKANIKNMANNVNNNGNYQTRKIIYNKRNP